LVNSTHVLAGLTATKDPSNLQFRYCNLTLRLFLRTRV